MIRYCPSLFAAILVTTACTGTQEARTPAYLVVVEGRTVGLVASPLPPDTAPGSEGLTWLEEFEHALPGDVIDLAVARELPTQVFVAYRTPGGADHVQRFLAEAVRPDAPETFAPAGDPIDVGDIVATAGPLTTPELCTQAVRVSSNARWLALLHEPAACGLDSFGAAVVLLDLAADPEPEVAFPAVASSEDAATPPLFLAASGGGEPGEMIYLEADGTLVRVALPDDGEVQELVPVQLDLVDPVGLGTGGLDLVVAESDALHTFRSGAPDDPVTLTSDAVLEAVVDAGSLPNAPLVVRSATGIVVYSDVPDDETDREPGELLVDGLTDAVVGPYGYGFLLAPNRIVAVDLLTYVGTSTAGDGDRLSAYVVPGIGGTDLPIEEPRAIDWIFGEVATADP